MTAKARAEAGTKAKHIYNTGINYDRHLRSLKYFYSTGHYCTSLLKSITNFTVKISVAHVYSSILTFQWSPARSSTRKDTYLD